MKATDRQFTRGVFTLEGSFLEDENHLKWKAGAVPLWYQMAT